MIILSSLLSLIMSVQALDTKELQSWREKREARLKAEDNWLTVVGLSWLKEGQNTIGSAFDSDVRLPSGGPKNLGVISLKAGKASIVFSSTEGVRLGNDPVVVDKVYKLFSDADEEFESVKLGSVSFFLIQRKNGLGVRVKDRNSKARKNFKGLSWYEPKPELKIRAKWHPHKEGAQKLMVPDIIGNMNAEKNLGFVEFEFAGQKNRLYPTGDIHHLFFVFKDTTNGKETYSASRFLYTDGPDKKGYINLDFNRAYNPPCAFTEYATCPRAPKENVLKVPIEAGEKKPL